MRLIAIAIAALVAGCTGSSLASDAGNLAGAQDAAGADAAHAVTDASVCADAGFETPDAATIGADAGAVDSGLPCGQSCLFDCAQQADGTACDFGLAFVPSTGALVWEHGQCIAGVCSDPKQDADNCQGIGATCGTGICTAYGCLGGGGAPPKSCTSANQCPDYQGCGNGHCGDCSVSGVCPPGGGCVNGRCVVSPCTQQSWYQQCAINGGVGICFMGGATGITCLDLRSDPSNCGSLGWVCPSGSTCDDGVCSGTPAGCGQGRQRSFCNVAQGASFICCPTGCADIASSTSNCGDCGRACAPGAECLSGTCAATDCTGKPDTEACDTNGAVGRCCSSVCRAIASDNLNCGRCGVACASGLTCREQACGVDACDAAGDGLPCHLGEGQLGRCCSSACVDTDNDSANCNGCGLVCPTPTKCAKGSCS